MDYLRERPLKSATNKSPKLSAKNCNPIARINIYNTFNIIIMRKHLNARKQLEQMIDQPVCNRSCPSSKDNNNKNNTLTHTVAMSLIHSVKLSMRVSIFVCCAFACNWQSRQHYICLIELLPHRRAATHSMPCPPMRVCVWEGSV